ncbi:hypothetical protein VTJ83DRAFT_7462 [Remersonia thermophila]|uniref:2-nitropropane dioxygenase n=1 Tax=Remersonia thermophila TaxID=72144 RepID=A0ABR4D3K1_9PEZI
MAARASRLQAWFPHVQHPVILSAPMLGTANGTLAAEVTKAGGIGVIPGGFDFLPGSPQLSALEAELAAARALLAAAGLATAAGATDPSPPATLPVAVGFILCHPSFATHFLATALPLLRQHRPRGVWLFAPRPEDEAASSASASSSPSCASGGGGGGGEDKGRETVLARAVRALRAEGFVVMAQVGTVAAARRAAAAGAQAVVVQGVDAGGHQYAAGAGVVSLLPEVADMLADEFGKGRRGNEGDEGDKGDDGGVVVVAAGGIVDGRGVAAALGLGAEGVVMGTRFIASHESWSPDFRKKLILDATDGGPSTVKTPVLDDIQGTPIWPAAYDGRALIGKSWLDHAAGLPLEENVRRFKEADAAGDDSRKITWAGTGVGLVREVKPAGQIVKEVREDAIRRIRGLQAAIGA